jgi:hypothetical protein
MAKEIVFLPLRFDTMTRSGLQHVDTLNAESLPYTAANAIHIFIDPQHAIHRLMQFQTQALKDTKQVLPNICQRREQAEEGPREAKEAQAQ